MSAIISLPPADPGDYLQRFISLAENPKQRSAEFMEPHRVAILLELSVSRIRQLADEGRLPHVKIFGRIYVHVPSLLEVLRKENAQR